MKCGFFEMDITPPLGSIIPGDFCARYANEVLDKLYVRTFVVRSGKTSLAIASIDACGITADITQSIRTKVCAVIPMKPEQIMVMATHAHGGGPTLNWGEEVVRDPQYLQILTDKTSASIITAWRNAQDSELMVGKEDLTDVSFIRVYRMKDGSLKTNPGHGNPNILEPTTTIDPEVLVLAVRQNGVYVGAVVNYANHPAIVATNQISGDYISVLSEEMKRLYGSQFISVFINGACGNINHYDTNNFATKSFTYHRVVGKRLAQSVDAAIQKAVPMTNETLHTECDSIYVKLRKPTEEQLIAAKRLFDSYGDELIEQVPGTPDYMEVFFALQAFQISADKRTQRRIDLQVFKIGTCYVFGTPCQLFVQFGKKMKAACSGTAFISAFANDYCGYVPTPDCMVPGVYEARLAATSALESAAGDKICDGIIELYHKCK